MQISRSKVDIAFWLEGRKLIYSTCSIRESSTLQISCGSNLSNKIKLNFLHYVDIYI